MLEYRTINGFSNYLIGNNGEVYNKQTQYSKLNKVSGLEVATFESIHEAERYTGIPSSNIVSCLKGRQSYTKEYSWCYVEEL